MLDTNVEKVVEKLNGRSAVGMAKYGCVTSASNIDIVGWLHHLQEELMDAAVYVEVLLDKIEG